MSKATRAQETIDRWNVGRVKLPMHDAWVPGFIARAMAFTGNYKSRDDGEVDALVSALDGSLEKSN